MAGSSNASVTKGHDIYFLDERRRAALAELDNAQFSYFVRCFLVACAHFPRSRFHLKVCLVAGAGFFTDAYV
jgi:PHS family inorganic phosphate transporter-like MFS transporter